jgi:hypothetical protein
MAVGSRRRQGGGNNVCYQGLSSIGKWRVSARRTSSLATVVARHFAPRIVGTCCRFNSSAIAVSVAKPAARSSLMTVAKAMARASAARLCAAPPLCPRLRGWSSFISSRGTGDGRYNPLSYISLPGSARRVLSDNAGAPIRDQGPPHLQKKRVTRISSS